MKPRKREIEIFNMSVLDLLTGALGAFCFLTLALFPAYFAHLTGEHTEAKAKTELAALRQKMRNQLAHLKPVSTKPKGMPPYALGIMQTEGTQNNLCGEIRITKYDAPGGHGSLSFVPIYGRGGFAQEFDLFMIAPGRYHLTLTAYSPVPWCTLSVAIVGRPLSPKLLHLTQNPKQYVLSLTVSAGDLTMPSVASQ